MTTPSNVVEFPRRHRAAWSDLEIVQGAVSVVLARLEWAPDLDEETRRFALQSLRLIVDWLEKRG